MKYDGYRLRLERDGDRVRLITRGGYDWTKRYRWIADAARKIGQKRFVLDGEAVILGVGGIPGFNALHSGKCKDEVQFCAFDILVEGGDDLRKLPLHLRKMNLQCLLVRRPEGVFVSEFERGEIAPIYSERHVDWVWRASSPSTVSARIRLAGPSCQTPSGTAPFAS